MSNKVKITKEQAEAIAFLKSEGYPDNQIIMNALDGTWVTEQNEPNIGSLNGLDVKKLVYAIDNLYIVDPQYKVGEYVVRADCEHFKSGSIAAKVTEVNKNRLYLGGQQGTFTYEYVRHATPKEIKLEKERQLWKSFGRDVGEFREGDVRLTTDYSSVYTTTTEVAKNEYNNGELKGFYPVESFIIFEEL